MSGNTSRARGPAGAGYETSTATARPYGRRLGSALAVGGILLVALNLRAAITSLSPIYDQIGRSFPLTPTAQGILGMLPPLAFALFGALAPRLEHKLGLEKALLLAMALVCSGQVARAFVSDIWLFGLFSVVCLAGMGLGNMLLPPVIKEYFPERIGLLTSLYTALTAVSAALPSFVAVPVTDVHGWRFSTGMWAALAFAAAVPWVLLLRDRQEPVMTLPVTRHAVWRWPTAWALAILFGVGALTQYVRDDRVAAQGAHDVGRSRPGHRRDHAVHLQWRGPAP